MSDSSDDAAAHSDNDSEDEFLVEENRRRDRRKRVQEENLYGVFYDGGDEDGGRRYDRNSRSTRDSTNNVAPLFVKGKIETDKEESVRDENDKDRSNEEDNDNEMMQVEEEEEEDADDLARMEALQKQQQAADEYFKSLLSRGKKPNRNATASSKSGKNNQANQSGQTSGQGLGFGGAGIAASTASTSNRGLGFHSASASFPLAEEMDAEEAPMFAGLGMPTAFGSNEVPRQKQKPAFHKKDPNLGVWEKHTKGIGMKLLAKMGYKGSGGLGSMKRKRNANYEEDDDARAADQGPVKTGISRPVEVVVRPANLGLGYGNFKEATKLKTNMQIEAEVRGIDLAKKEKEEEEKRKKLQETSMFSASTTSSALPSVQDLMKQQSWKRGASRTTSRKRPRRTIIPYQELLEQRALQQQQQSTAASVIIDMRGPSVTTPQEGAMAQVPLAEELLHNLSLLLNTYENKLHAASHFAKSTKQKVTSLQSDIENMERRQQHNKDRIVQLTNIMETMDHIESICNTSNLSQTKQPLTNEHVQQVQEQVKQLESSFTSQERTTLKFYEVLAPSMLEPVLRARIEQWDPLQSNLESSRQVMESVVNICQTYHSTKGGNNDRRGTAVFAMMRSLFLDILLPKVQKALESSRWDPVRSCEMGLDLYEILQQVAQQASAARPLSNKQREDIKSQGDESVLPQQPHAIPAEDDEDGLALLQDIVREEIIHKTVYVKLSRALSQWKPVLNDMGTDLRDRPSSWMIPWLPHLDHRSILPTLLADCKRKLKSAVSFLNQSIEDDHVFCRACLATLKPWYPVFPGDTLHSAAGALLPMRLAGCIAQQPLLAVDSPSPSPASGSAAVDLVLDMYNARLLSEREFLSIIEGELLAQWATSMQRWLVKTPSQWMEAAKLYTKWKRCLLQVPHDGETTLGDAIRSPQQCMRQDLGICSSFYIVLLIIQAARNASEVDLDDLLPMPTSYRAVAARRAREERERAEAELARVEASGSKTDEDGVEARIRLHHRHQQTPTFREVVEEFAREQDVLLQPRLGRNKAETKDGKLVFLFGSIPIYWDANVVYAFHNSTWHPTSLGELAALAAKEKS